jgi:hypothetical protein
MKNCFLLVMRGLFPTGTKLSLILFLSLNGCSSQDESKKELPPVPEKVQFTPSESSKLKPVGMDGK